MPINIFNFQTYNFLKHDSLKDRFKKSLSNNSIYRSRSSAPLSDKRPPSSSKNSKSKSNEKRIYLHTPKKANYSAMLDSHARNAHVRKASKECSTITENNPSKARVALSKSFLSRSKVKRKIDGIEKGLKELTNCLQELQADLRDGSRGGRLEVQASPNSGQPNIWVTKSGVPMQDKGILKKIEEINYISNNQKSLFRINGSECFNQQQPQRRVFNDSGVSNASQAKATNATEEKVKGLLSKITMSKPLLEKRSGVTLDNYLSTVFKSSERDSEERSDNLFKAENQNQPLRNHSSINPPDEQDRAGKELQETKEHMKSIITTMGELLTQFVEKKPSRTARKEAGVQADAGNGGRREIQFSNINLLKMNEELIKKVSVSSKMSQYNAENIGDWFALLESVPFKWNDHQKQQVFIELFTLQQRQMLIDETIEIVKEAGVNVQNLFKFTFKRLGLDYDEYVKYEQSKDGNKGSETPVFDGEAYCSFEETEGLAQEKTREELGLDFNNLRGSEEDENQQEDGSELAVSEADK